MLNLSYVILIAFRQAVFRNEPFLSVSLSLTKLSENPKKELECSNLGVHELFQLTLKSDYEMFSLARESVISCFLSYFLPRFSLLAAANAG